MNRTIARALHRTIRRVTAAAALAVLAVAAPALAGTPARSGGAAYAEPEVEALRCSTGEPSGCPRGAVLRLSGDNLEETRAVVFLGGRGARDDSRARPKQASPHRVLVQVPRAARSGPVRVVAASRTAVGPRLRVLAAAADQALASPLLAGSGAFPIQGEHSYGSEVNRFGGGRGHKGQDVLAACSTPVVAALPGEVTLARFEQRAGNYAVVKADDGTSQAYMHMLAPATVTKGQRVAAGEPLGQIGRSGAATACHLHFELWTAPGWYEGGRPVDPLGFLRALDAPS